MLDSLKQRLNLKRFFGDLLFFSMDTEQPLENVMWRQIKLFLALLFCVFLVLYPYGALKSYLNTRLAAEINRSGIFYRYAKFEELGLAEYAFENLGLTIPAHPLPLPLFFEKLSAKAYLRDLFWLSLHGKLSGEAYGGTVNTELKRGFFRSHSVITTIAQSLDISKHPLPRILGLGGSLSLSTFAIIPDFPDTTPYPLNEGTIQADLENASYTGTYKIGGIIPLPAISNARLSLRLEAEPPLVELKFFDFQSTLGEVQASGSAEVLPLNISRTAVSATRNPNIPPGLVSALSRLKTLNLIAEIKLSDEGVEKFGGYLSLLQQTTSTETPPLPAGIKNWKLIINKDSGDPVIRIEPLS